MRRTASRTAKLAEAALPGLSVVVFLILWELVVRWRGIAPIYLPAPTSIALQMWQMIAGGSLEFHLGVTLLRIFAGFLFPLCRAAGFTRTAVRSVDRQRSKGALGSRQAIRQLSNAVGGIGSLELLNSSA